MAVLAVDANKTEKRIKTLPDDTVHRRLKPYKKNNLVAMNKKSHEIARATAADLIKEALTSSKAALNEWQSKTLFAAYGIPVPEGVPVKSETEAAAAVEQIRGRAVLKAIGTDIHHKTEAGLVVLGVEDPEEAAATYRLLKKRAAGALEAVLVEQMVAGNRELMVGMKRDPVFGPVVAFGLGGVLAEALGARPFLLPEERRVLYHAAACVAANYLVTLEHVAERMFVEAGLPPDNALDYFLPLVRGAVENVSAQGTVASLTGPLSRGDVCTIVAHLEVLQQVAPELDPVYRTLGLATLDIVRRRPEVPPETIQALEQLLEGANYRQAGASRRP
mgnify:CR=1 FL=1